MAVESTPKRSLSDLFMSSRAVEATPRWGPPSPRCRVVIIALEVASIDDAGRTESSPHLPRSCRARHGGRAGSCRPKTVAGFFPMRSALGGDFGIDQHIRDILNVAHFPGTAANLEQRIVSG